jgi:hypothetical protein
MGFIQNDRAPGLHCETRSESAVLYTAFGDQRVEIDRDKLPGVIVALAEAWLRFGLTASELRQPGSTIDERLQRLTLEGLMTTPDYQRGLQEVAELAEERAREEERTGLDAAAQALPAGYRIVKDT